MHKRYQVFVSSTFRDLKEERAAVMEVIMRMNFIPAGMEMFPAMDEKVFKYIQRIIDDSDYFLLIIGGCYGSVDVSGVSWTEKEYDYALKQHKHILVFDHENYLNLPGSKIDKDKEKLEKLEAFKQKVANGGIRVIDKWSNADKLAMKVSTSLANVQKIHPVKGGWVRAEEFLADNEGILNELKELRDERVKHQALFREAQGRIKSLEAELKNLKSSMGRDQATIETITIPGTGVSFNMVRVEGGMFIMGANEGDEEAWNDEKPAHQVTLSDYYIGETQVTQALWQAVMRNNPSLFKGDPNRPVERVSWDDCQEFIKKLNSLTGKSFRLPTEAQWEFAARGGNKSKGYKYAGGDDLDEVAWYGRNSSDKTHPVAQKAANELGLYDMSGNVWEWCQDWYGDYANAQQTNPVGPTMGYIRVDRGGSWNNIARYCRVSYRNDFEPTANMPSNLGLRLAL